MKVLLATAFHLDPQMGGPAHTVATTGLKLSECGVDTSLLTGTPRGLPAAHPSASMRAIAKVDLVHHFGIWSPLCHAICLTARLSRVPFVIAPAGMLEPWALAQSARRKRLALLTYQGRDLARAAAVHATAAAEVDSIRALGIKTPIALIPHGIDVPRDVPREHAESGLGPRTLLFLSRLHPKKGLLDLVQAWAQLRPADWRVIVAGPDERNHRAEVEAAVRRHGLGKDFEFIGQVSPEHKEHLLRSADLFVLPTYSENFGLVVPEALGRRTPVLTTRGTPWSELVETQSGWWIDPGAPSLAAALAEILPTSRAQLRSMGDRGRRLVIERYSWAAVVAKHVELYQWILGQASKPSFVFD